MCVCVWEGIRLWSSTAYVEDISWKGGISIIIIVKDHILYITETLRASIKQESVSD